MATTKAPVVYADIADDFSLNGQGGIKVVQNADAVKAAVRNILLTRKGERVMLPNFGSGIQDYIFEAMDQDLTGVIAQQVKQDIETWEPRVEVQSVKLQTNPDQQTVAVQVYYRVIGYDNVFETSYTFKA